MHLSSLVDTLLPTACRKNVLPSEIIFFHLEQPLLQQPYLILSSDAEISPFCGSVIFFFLKIHNGLLRHSLLKLNLDMNKRMAKLEEIL
jgi:hypothetical protein